MLNKWPHIFTDNKAVGIFTTIHWGWQLELERIISAPGDLVNLTTRLRQFHLIWSTQQRTEKVKKHKRPASCLPSLICSSFLFSLVFSLSYVFKSSKLTAACLLVCQRQTSIHKTYEASQGLCDKSNPRLYSWLCIPVSSYIKIYIFSSPFLYGLI